MRVALAQLDLRIGDIAGAMASLAAASDEAAAQGADLLVASELAAFGGYPPRDLIGRRHLVESQWRALTALAARLPIPALIGAVEPLPDGRSSANVLAICLGGRVVGTYRKRLLPTYDVFDEVRYFQPGDAPLIVEIAGSRVGLTVCEDIWSEAFTGVRYACDPVADLVGRCDLLVNASASPFHMAKPAVRRALIAAVARRVGCPVVYCNQVGGQDELLFDGDSRLVDARGALIVRGPRWAAGVVVGETPGAADPVIADTDPEPIADLYQGLVTGIRDYCAKTGQERVVLGLSGGIDSALVAALASDALGADRVLGLLMPGPYSSPGSITDAESLARNLGMRHAIIPIGTPFQSVLTALSGVFAGRPMDVAEENLQSRMRGLMVMAVANKDRAMALTTGNKSELATGYCTIYGDMNGGLAPIGDVYKSLVWKLARHANQGRERIPASSITKPPSAELRPEQLDSDSLPAYEILDRILLRYLEEGASPETIIAGGEDPAVVARVVRLVEISEFKRRQAPPALRVTPKAFGIGRRMPVARWVG